MAYTLPNIGVIRADKAGARRYVHRRAVMTVNASGAASALVDIPVPGRLVAVNYGLADATSHYEPYGNSAGVLVIKAETTDGVQIFTDADISSVPTRPQPVGTTAVDEGRAATAATDGFSGGFPVRSGVYMTIASGTEGHVVHVDMWFRLCTYVKGELISQSGADGAGAVTRDVRLNSAGVLAAVAFDFQNMPNTTDIVIRADSSTGPLLFTGTSSNTDLAPSLVGAPGLDEAINATAATDGTECGNAFRTGLYIDVAEADAFTSSNEKIVYELWIDD